MDAGPSHKFLFAPGEGGGNAAAAPYRGRLAPTPTGLLHRGHGLTFALAFQRCRRAAGTLVMRMEDLDPRRCRPEFASAALEDLAWLGLAWEEGPDCGGAYGPYLQSARRDGYLRVWQALKDGGWIYPCLKSRRDIKQRCGQTNAWSRVSAPHEDEEAREPLFPVEWRPPPSEAGKWHTPEGANWRFRVPEGVVVRFRDGALGDREYLAGVDFGDFLVWSRDDVPSYELAVVADDHAMAITEVVRGADLLKSTARQLLVYRALGWPVPDFYHCPLVRDAHGRRLAKRTDAESLRALRERGCKPEEAGAVPANTPASSANS